jgi:hypothetical protein
MTEKNASKFEAVTWGARGSVPADGTDYTEFGGATCCVELRIDGRILVQEAGLWPLVGILCSAMCVHSTSSFRTRIWIM